MRVSTQVSCHCPHKCLGSVHTSVMSLSTQASCHYTHKRHVNIQRRVTSLSRLVFQTSVVIIQTSVTSLSKQATSLSKQATSLSKQASHHYPNNRRHYPNKRRHYPNKRQVIIQTSVTSLSKQATSLSKQALKPLYWHTPPRWYSRYEHVHPYKLFTECTTVNRCCTSVNPCCTTADSFTGLLPTQCWVENGIALPHTLFHLATVKDRNRLAWCDLYFYFTSAHPWEKSRLCQQ